MMAVRKQCSVCSCKQYLMDVDTRRILVDARISSASFFPFHAFLLLEFLLYSKKVLPPTATPPTSYSLCQPSLRSGEHLGVSCDIKSSVIYNFRCDPT
jgi:hypothetical protein